MAANEPRILVDRSCFPLVFHAMYPGYTDGDIAAMCEAYDGLLNGQARYAILIYFHPDAQMMKPTSRKVVVDWWQQRKERVASLNVAAAIVVRSGLIRGALTAMQWIVQPRNPHVVVASAVDGVDVCTARLHAANIAVSAHAIASLRARVSDLV